MFLPVKLRLLTATLLLYREEVKMKTKHAVMNVLREVRNDVSMTAQFFNQGRM